MDSSADTRAAHHAQEVEQALVVRVCVLGVVFAGAVALGLAAVMSGYAMGGPPLAAMLVAVAGGVTWVYAPRVGYWLLLLDGIAVVVPAGIGLVTGAVPWLLVGFWGGSMILLAAVLHLIVNSSPGISTTATLVAVISLLALSALGLLQYVTATWAPGERAMLERIPQLVSSASGQGPAWVEPVSPAPRSGWRCAWVLRGTPSQAIEAVRAALGSDGWRIESSSADQIVAEKDGEQLAISIAGNPDRAPDAPAGTPAQATQITATVSRSTADYH